jgi:undecaprenyl pyrophosphate phosphatase UppP
MIVVKNLVRQISRHVVAIIIAGLVGVFGADAIPETLMTDMEMVITTVLMLAVYAIFEKALKPLWLRFFNEVPTEEVVG